MRRVRSRLAVGCVFGSLILSLVSPAALAQGPFADPAFAETWSRTDAPVSNGQVSRTYYWGPCTSTPGGLSEPLNGAPGNQRTVQYFDKSRMEINEPNGDRTSPWFVTNGLLATELITGRRQIGYTLFETLPASDQAVAGDPGDTLAPSYRALGRVMATPPRALGAVITETIDGSGNTGNNPGLASYGVVSSDLIPETNHRLASVFRDFLLSQGPVIEGGQLIDAPLSNPTFFVTGYPTSEAYWARAAIGGVVKDVLIQSFERRVLTYVPSNSPEFRVEMGNIGLHYRAWRYKTSLNYFAALVGNSLTYTNSGSGLDGIVRYADLDGAFKPGQTLLRVETTIVGSATPRFTEFVQERDGQLLYHGYRVPGGETVKYEPPYVLFRTCMDVGQEWSTEVGRLNGGTPQMVTYRFRVEAAETVVTPGGAFQAFRIHQEDTDTTDGSVKEATIWFSPYIGVVKRQILEFTGEVKAMDLR